MMSSVSNKQSFEAVYHVTAQKSNRPFNPIAIRPQFFRFNLDNNVVEQRCEWKDTDRGTSVYFKEMHVENVQENQPPRKFTLLTEDDEVLEFTFMTASLFNEKIKHLTSGSLNPTSDQELQAYYLKTKS